MVFHVLQVLPMQIMYNPPQIMIAMAISLAAVNTFCTLVANLTLKQLIKVIKPFQCQDPP